MLPSSALSSFVKYFLFESRGTGVLALVCTGVCRGVPGSLLYDLHEVMHIVFDIPIRFEGSLEDKVFVYIVLKSYPVRCF